MSNPRRLLELVKENQNLVLDGKTRSTVNTNMADKPGEAQETPSVARMERNLVPFSEDQVLDFMHHIST